MPKIYHQSRENIDRQSLSREKILKAVVHPKKMFKDQIHAHFVKGNRVVFFKNEAVLTVLEMHLLRRFRVWCSGLGVPTWLTGFRWSHLSRHEQPKEAECRCGSIRRLRINVRLLSENRDAIDVTVGSLSEDCQSNRNAQSRSHTRKRRRRSLSKTVSTAQILKKLPNSPRQNEHQSKVKKKNSGELPL